MADPVIKTYGCRDDWFFALVKITAAMVIMYVVCWWMTRGDALTWMRPFLALLLVTYCVVTWGWAWLESRDICVEIRAMGVQLRSRRGDVYLYYADIRKAWVEQTPNGTTTLTIVSDAGRLQADSGFFTVEDLYAILAAMPKEASEGPVRQVRSGRT